MTEDRCARVSSEFDSSMTKQRKRRKWDQPDESLVTTVKAVPGIFPLVNMGYIPRINLPNVSAVAGASLAIPLSTSSPTLPRVLQVPLKQHAAAIVQKLVQVCELELGFFHECDALVRNLQGRLDILAGTLTSERGS